MSTKFEAFTGRVVVLAADNVDTDQIIPARFLKTIGRDGLGEQLFHDWRYDADGRARPDFALNRPGAAGAPILLAGDNFGCGSSREHAAWALVQFGFRAVLSTSFADIFRQNALKNALLPIVISRQLHVELTRLLGCEPGTELSIDLEAQSLTLPSRRRAAFEIDSFARRCLLDGVDELGYILLHEARIAEFERRSPLIKHKICTFHTSSVAPPQVKLKLADGP